MNHTQCERCNSKTFSRSMSFFNTQMCCPNCLLEESLHPDYAEAKRIEVEQVNKKNYNFPGVGLPEDLKLKYSL